MALGVVLIVGALASCASPKPEPPTAAELFGTWTVTSPSGDQGMVSLDDEGLVAWKDACTGEAEWATLEGAFVGRSRYFNGRCWEIRDNGPTWLGSVVEVTAADDGWALRDASGTVTARLTAATDPGEVPSRFPVAPWDEPLPTTTELSSPPVPLPPGLSDAGVSGDWIVDVAYDDTLTLAGTTWTMHSPYDATRDYCTAREGHWVNLGAGRVLTSPASAGDVSCTGPEGLWMAQTRLAGLDGDELVLLDRDGNELKRLLPAG